MSVKPAVSEEVKELEGMEMTEKALREIREGV